MTAFLALMAIALLVLALLGAVAYAWDPFNERADARSRSREPRYWGKR